MIEKRRVVVTGIGMVTPFGNGKYTFWTNAMSGNSATRLIQSFDPTTFRSRVVGECLNFDPLFVVSPSEVSRYDRFSLLALAAGTEALEDSGLKPISSRTGVVMGNGMGGATTSDRQYEMMRTKGRRWVNPLTVPLAMHNAAAANLAQRFQLRGPALTIANACASGANAIGEGFRMIAHGFADAILAGGTEAAITVGIYTAWDALRVMAICNDIPAKASKPFSKDRTGFVMAEGAAVVVLEEFTQAEQRGAPIYAELVGYGVTSDAYHVTRPSLDGEIDAIRLALEDARIRPDQIDYINAHGTATVVNDTYETNAIKDVFGDAAYQIPVSSTKSMIGHSIGAAGAIEFAALALAIHYQQVPPTVNLEVPDPDCDLDYVAGGGRACQIIYGLSNSFGFGGCNAILVAKRIS